MIYTILSAVVILIEAYFIGRFIFLCVRRKKVLSLDAAWYFVPTLFITIALYFLGITYLVVEKNYNATVFDYINLINNSLSIFKAKIDTDFTAELLGANYVYYAAFLIATVMALATFFLFVGGAIKHFFRNRLQVKRCFADGCDILIGKSDENETYAESYKNVVFWADYPLSSEEKKDFRKKGITYISCDFTEEELSRRLGASVNTEAQFHLIALNGKDKNLKYISEFKRFINKRSSTNVYLYVKLDYDNFITINNKILADTKYAAYINCFNKYELIARKFVESYPITRYMPSKFFDYDLACVRDDVTVNVFYFGFGKISSALYRAQVMNDQLPTVSGGKYGGDVKHFLVNYYAYDVLDRKNENKNSNYYDNRFYSEYSKFTSDKYFEVPGKICNFGFFNNSIDHAEAFENFKATAFAGDRVFNNIIVSYGDDVDNIDYALKTAMLFKQNDFADYHIFIRVKKYQKEYDAFFDGKATFFGYDDFVINHKVVVDENLTAKAKSVNASYEQKSKEISKWAQLPAIKKMSNVYSGLNVRLKLNLLGYDLAENDGKNYSATRMSELLEKVKEGAPTEKSVYSDYFFFDKDVIFPANVLASQEKMRWNAFYINNGYVPMPKDAVYYKKVGAKDYFYKDDDDKKLHACITTDKGLDEYHRLIAKLKSDATGEDFETCLEDLQTYKYDYSFANVADTFDEKSDYVVIEKNL